jgi:hypothetical protein
MLARQIVAESNPVFILCMRRTAAGKVT